MFTVVLSYNSDINNFYYKQTSSTFLNAMHT